MSCTSGILSTVAIRVTMSAHSLSESYTNRTKPRDETGTHFHDNIIKRFRVNVSSRNCLNNSAIVLTKGRFSPFLSWPKATELIELRGVTVAKQIQYKPTLCLGGSGDPPLGH